MSSSPPQIVILGGPNGAGKSTSARVLLPELMQLGEFVNADTIAAGLAGFAPERAAFAAGRIMLARLHELAAARVDFAFETTMASRTFVPWLRMLRKSGYQINIIFLWLRSPELAIRRVKRRVRQGGHSVPEDTIRRRFHRGIANFASLYLPLADRWRAYDNSRTGSPRLIAQGGGSRPTIIMDTAAWKRLSETEAERGEDQEHL